MTDARNLEREEFRAAMSRLGAAVNIVTTNGLAGRQGMVASAVCSVSDTPPTLLVCVNRTAVTNAFARTNRTFCVNVLGSDQDGLSRVFADSSLPIAERFERAGKWTSLVTGAPALCAAPAAIDCHIVQTIEVGSHTIFVGQVAKILLGKARGGLIYFDRSYHRTSSLVEARPG